MALRWQGELVPAKSGTAWRVSAGDLLKVVDVEGGQTGDVFAVAADDLDDGLSNGQSINYADSIRLTTGSVLYSRSSRPLLTIVEDEVGTHDFLYAPCSQRMFEIVHGVSGPVPNCFDNLTAGLGKFGVPATTVTVAFNVFMNVEIGDDGGLKILQPVTTAGKSITFEAQRDVLVGVTACAAASASGGRTLSLLVETGAAM